MSNSANVSDSNISDSDLPPNNDTLTSEIKPEPKGIWSPSFQGLLWTNWLTAINDNIFRWFVIGVGKTFWSPKYHSAILMLGTVLFVLPYVSLASPAGWLADRFQKRTQRHRGL